MPGAARRSRGAGESTLEQKDALIWCQPRGIMEPTILLRLRDSLDGVRKEDSRWHGRVFLCIEPGDDFLRAMLRAMKASIWPTLSQVIR